MVCTVFKGEGEDQLGIRLAACALLLLAILFALSGCMWLQDWINPNPPTDLREITKKGAEVILDTQVSGLELYERLKEEGGPNVLEKTVAWLKTQPEVSDSGVAPDGNISVLYNSGLIGTLLIHTTAILNPGISAISTTSALKMLNSRENLVSLKTTSATSPGNKKAVILLPFQSKKLQKNVDNLIDNLESAGYIVDGPIVNEEVTLERMKTLGQYSVIYIITHGALTWDFPFSHVEIATGQRADPSSLMKIWNELVRKAAYVYTFKPNIGLMTVKVKGKKQSYFTVYEGFIDDFTYPNSLIVVNACNSFGNDTLADAFLKSGAAIYFGWTDITCLYFINQVTEAIFNLSTKPNFGVIEAYDTPYAFKDWGTYSVNQLFPGTFYRDKNNNDLRYVCYSNRDRYGNRVCGGDEGDRGAKVDFETDFVYKLRDGIDDLILNPATNQPPVAIITSPPNNSTFTEGEPVTFKGSATDPEDGPLTGSSLVWTSNIDGQIGTGESFTRSDLSVGDHTITFTATDSQGAIGRDSIKISIGPRPPEVAAKITSYSASPREITVPSNVTLSITIKNTGNVAECTFYVGGGLRRPDGTIDSLPLKPITLDPGQQGSTSWTYTINTEGGWDVVFGVWEEPNQETSLDYKGWFDDYIIGKKPPLENKPPVARFTYLARSPINPGVEEWIVFDATGSYDPDGTIRSYEWTFGDGTTATGLRVNKRYSSSGVFTVRLIVTDDDGATGETSQEFQVRPVAEAWKASAPVEDCELVDSRGVSWYEVDFNDSNWANVNLPDDDTWNCENCDRYYRIIFYLSSVNRNMKVYFESDDGLWLYVNGSSIGHWGGDCHDHGCVNNPRGRCNRILNVGPIDITDKLVEGRNIIAVHVSEWMYNEYFDFSFITKPLEENPLER